MQHSILAPVTPKAKRSFCVLVFALFAAMRVWAAVGGSITGIVTDSTGAVIPAASLTLVNQAQQTTYKAVSNAQGAYTFLNLPVGRYDLTVTAMGFAAKKQTDLVVDTDSNLRADVALAVGGVSDTVTVTSDIAGQIDTISTHLGEAVSGEDRKSVV